MRGPAICALLALVVVISSSSSGAADTGHLSAFQPGEADDRDTGDALDVQQQQEQQQQHQTVNAYQLLEHPSGRAVPVEASTAAQDDSEATDSDAELANGVDTATTCDGSNETAFDASDGHGDSAPDASSDVGRAAVQSGVIDPLAQDMDASIAAQTAAAGATDQAGLTLDEPSQHGTLTERSTDEAERLVGTGSVVMDAIVDTGTVVTDIVMDPGAVVTDNVVDTGTVVTDTIVVAVESAATAPDSAAPLAGNISLGGGASDLDAGAVAGDTGASTAQTDLTGSNRQVGDSLGSVVAGDSTPPPKPSVDGLARQELAMNAADALDQAEDLLFRNASGRDLARAIGRLQQLVADLHLAMPSSSKGRRKMGDPVDSAQLAQTSGVGGTAMVQAPWQALERQGTGLEVAGRATFILAALEAAQLLPQDEQQGAHGGDSGVDGGGDSVSAHPALLAPSPFSVLQQLHQAGRAGSSEALLALAHRFKLGDGVEQSSAMALLFAKQAAAVVAADVEREGRFVVALAPPQLRDLYMDATYKVADSLENSPQVVQMDEDLAIRGDVDAQRRMAYRRLMGRGIPVDLPGAYHDFAAAAQQGDANALFNIGYMYLRGMYVAKNVSLARDYFEQSALKGLPSGWNGLGVLYWSGDADGAGRNLTAAFECFEKGAALNNSDALFNLGNMYMSGLAVEKNETKAVELIHRAEGLGHWRAPYTLALAYDEGRGVPKRDSAMAWTLMRRFFSDRTTWSDDILAASRALDDGDHWGALVQFLLLAEQGSDTAATNAAWMLQQGLGYDGPHAHAMAIKLLRRSAKLGLTSSMVELGHLLSGDAAAAAVKGGARPAARESAAAHAARSHVTPPSHEGDAISPETAAGSVTSADGSADTHHSPGLRQEVGGGGAAGGSAVESESGMTSTPGALPTGSGSSSSAIGSGVAQGSPAEPLNTADSEAGTVSSTATPSTAGAGNSMDGAADGTGTSHDGNGTSSPPESAASLMFSEALFWYQKAADADSVEGCYYLGWAHQAGLGTPRNATRAHELYHRALKLAGKSPHAAPLHAAVALLHAQQMMTPWLGDAVVINAARSLRCLLPRPGALMRLLSPGASGIGRPPAPPAADSRRAGGTDASQGWWDAGGGDGGGWWPALDSVESDDLLLTVLLGALVLVLWLRSRQMFPAGGTRPLPPPPPTPPTALHQHVQSAHQEAEGEQRQPDEDMGRLMRPPDPRPTSQPEAPECSTGAPPQPPLPAARFSPQLLQTSISSEVEPTVQEPSPAQPPVQQAQVGPASPAMPPPPQDA